MRVTILEYGLDMYWFNTTLHSFNCFVVFEQGIEDKGKQYEAFVSGI